MDLAALITRLSEAVDLDSPVPYYVQLKEALRKVIAEGSLSPGDQLPGEP